MADLGRRSAIASSRRPLPTISRAFAEEDQKLAGFNFAEIGVEAEDYVVVATQGKRDREALAAALGTAARYVAFVGSRRKAEVLKAQIAEQGLASEQIARLKAPAGLDIHGIEPEEIALSILAEIVAFRRAGVKDVAMLPDAIEDGAALLLRLTAALTAASCATLHRVAPARCSCDHRLTCRLSHGASQRVPRSIVPPHIHSSRDIFPAQRHSLRTLKATIMEQHHCFARLRAPRSSFLRRSSLGLAAALQQRLRAAGAGSSFADLGPAALSRRPEGRRPITMPAETDNARPRACNGLVSVAHTPPLPSAAAGRLPFAAARNGDCVLSR